MPTKTTMKAFNGKYSSVASIRTLPKSRWIHSFISVPPSGKKIFTFFFFSSLLFRLKFESIGFSVAIAQSTQSLSIIECFRFSQQHNNNNSATQSGDSRTRAKHEKERERGRRGEK